MTNQVTEWGLELRTPDYEDNAARIKGPQGLEAGISVQVPAVWPQSRSRRINVVL